MCAPAWIIYSVRYSDSILPAVLSLEITNSNNSAAKLSDAVIGPYLFDFTKVANVNKPMTFLSQHIFPPQEILISESTRYGDVFMWIAYHWEFFFLIGQVMQSVCRHRRMSLSARSITVPTLYCQWHSHNLWWHSSERAIVFFPHDQLANIILLLYSHDIDP